MRRLAAGDKSALAALVRRHQQRVLALAYRATGNRDLAEDIGQEAFLRIWRSAARYEPSARVTTWIYRIVVNLCMDAGRKKQPVSSGLVLPDAETPEPLHPNDLRDRDEAVRRAVEALPERQRIAVLLHRFSDLSLRDIAAVTEWSESAVESLLVRAYRTLRESLKSVAEP